VKQEWFFALEQCHNHCPGLADHPQCPGPPPPAPFANIGAKELLTVLWHIKDELAGVSLDQNTLKTGLEGVMKSKTNEEFAHRFPMVLQMLPEVYCAWWQLCKNI
jgi:hypothetical protein